MRLICEFSEWAKPVGWALNKTRGGSRVRPKPLADYHRRIADVCRIAMAGEPPYLGLVRMEMDVFRVTPSGCRDGDPWGVTVEPDGKGGYVKKGLPTPDLGNVLKATEDALQGIVIGDDAQCSAHLPRRLYGPREGVVVRVYAL